MIIDMVGYYNMIKKLNIDIIYSGPIWANGIEGVGETLRKRLEVDELSLSASQSVFSVFVEQMNNMLMYSNEKKDNTNSENGLKGIFVLGVKNKTYFIQTGNVMKSESMELLKSRIDYLNTLDKAGLRKYYREQIKTENKNPGSKGAALGLIEIARRAGSPIQYSFMPRADGLVFLTMFITIEKGGN